MSSDKNTDAVTKKADEVVTEWLKVSSDLREEVAIEHPEFVTALVGLMELVNPAAYSRYSAELEEEAAAAAPRQ